MNGNTAHSQTVDSLAVQNRREHSDSFAKLAYLYSEVGLDQASRGERDAATESAGIALVLMRLASAIESNTVSLWADTLEIVTTECPD